MILDSWQLRLDDFWEAAPGKDATTLGVELECLVESGIPAGHAAFERASLHDYLGEEEQAIPLHRMALESGTLSPAKCSEARIQLASSLRNIGEPGPAAAILQDIGPDNPLHADAQAFLGLALFDAGEESEALKTALTALAPALQLCAGPVRRYAQELADGRLSETS
ncbi:tetratricopeptide repeat protein [Glutamicibacter soli]|uniref:Tetratricopeptide repeat protein n=1 Tax=Glutamicibacter soli TaxID=453836 RepID=A0A6L9G270_9MICC|nr:tetratricopeptide repeat protein [Glutamicibacter soli]NAZ15408.1 tetratricopeptide repeat protein [Glutamicibacter soli]